MSKYVLTNKEQFCQSFWQSVKEQKFKAKKLIDPPSPPPPKASRLLGFLITLAVSWKRKPTLRSSILHSTALTKISNLAGTWTDSPRASCYVTTAETRGCHQYNWRANAQSTCLAFRSIRRNASWSSDRGLMMVSAWTWSTRATQRTWECTAQAPSGNWWGPRLRGTFSCISAVLNRTRMWRTPLSSRGGHCSTWWTWSCRSWLLRSSSTSPLFSPLSPVSRVGSDTAL